MQKKFGNGWVEYRDRIDLINQPSNMEIDLCWYWKRTNNKLTYDLTDHLMIKNND